MVFNVLTHLFLIETIVLHCMNMLISIIELNLLVSLFKSCILVACLSPIMRTIISDKILLPAPSNDKNTNAVPGS